MLKLAKPLSARTAPVALGVRDYFPAGDHFLVAGYGSVNGLNDGTFGRLTTAELAAVRRQPEMQLRLVDPGDPWRGAGPQRLQRQFRRPGL